MVARQLLPYDAAAGLFDNMVSPNTKLIQKS